MSNGMTIDALYEAFMDIDEEGIATDETPFAEDVYGFFSSKLGEKGWESGEWASTYGMYLPTFDPAQIHLAERERDLDYRKAMNTLRTTQDSLDRVYSTEMDTLSTALGKEMEKGKQVAGRTGIRSGGLEAAIEDTIATSGSKVKDLGDRLKISETETKDKYNIAMVDTALDFDKTVEGEKEKFYDRTMASIMRLMDTGAFDCPNAGETWCEKAGMCTAPDACDVYAPLGYEEYYSQVYDPCLEMCVEAGFSDCETHCHDEADALANMGSGLESFDTELFLQGLGDVVGIEDLTDPFFEDDPVVHDDDECNPSDACWGWYATGAHTHCLGTGDWGGASASCIRTYIEGHCC